MIKRDEEIILSSRDKDMTLFPPTQYLDKYDGHVAHDFDIQKFATELTDAELKFFKEGKFDEWADPIGEDEKRFLNEAKNGTKQDMIDYISELVNLNRCGWYGWATFLDSGDFEFNFEGEPVVF